MFNVLLITPSQRDAVATAREELDKIKALLREGQVDCVRFRHAERGSPDRLAEILAETRYDVLHVNMSKLPVGAPEQGQGLAAPAREAEQPLLSASSEPGKPASRPVVILDACSAQQAAQMLPGSFPCLIELPAGSDRDSALSFLAGLYETLTRGHTLQTAFWLGCCKTKATQGPGPSFGIRSAPGFDPRKTAYSVQPTAKLPAPSAEEFFNKYSELCSEIKKTIFEPLLRRYDELLARVYDGAGPVPVEQEVEFSNDFAELTIAVYRGPRALELQREKFDTYEDPSRNYADLYEWTVHTEVGEADLENWMKDQVRRRYDAHDAYHRDTLGNGWQKVILDVEGRDGLARNFFQRDVGFADVAGIEFSYLIRKLYADILGDPGP
jgi:hypothetical protein